MSSNYLAYMTPLRRSIVEELNLWRAMELKDLKDRINYQNSDQGLRKILRDLKKHRWITSKKVGFTGKDFYYINKEFHSSFSECQSPIYEETLYHDILTSKFIMSLTKYYKIKDYKISPMQDDNTILEPDAEITISYDHGPQKIAVEVELTRKSIKRYLTKFTAYNQSREFDLVMYVFNDLSIFKSYKTRLIEEFKNLNHCKIILILNSTLNISEINLKATRVFAFGEELTLDDLFDRRGEIAC